MPTDSEALLEEQLRLFAVRQRRIMRAIQKYTAREEEADESGEGGRAARRERTMEVIQRLENGLTRVQQAKRECIEALNKIRKSRGETNSLADDWVKALLDGEAGQTPPKTEE